MTTILLDLWHDLREKRLWPIAAALLAATAAVPVLLFKPAGQSATDVTPTPVGAKTESLPVVSLADTAGHVSKLDAFAKRNPFKPLAKVKSTTTTSSTTPAASKTSGSKPTGSSAGGSGGSGGGGTPSGSPSGGQPSTTTGGGRKYFTFRVNVKFGPRGKAKTYKDVKQLSFLPDAKNPVLVFMGMKDDFKTAVFLVDDTKYQADGEGHCAPSPSKCSFVELKVDENNNEETIATPDGSSEYVLKLTGITRTFLTPEQAKGNAKDTNTPSTPSNGKKLAKAAGGKNAPPKVQKIPLPLFELPSFAAQG